MKKIIFLSLLLASGFSFAQYPTFNSNSTPGLAIGVTSVNNFSDAAVHIKAADNSLYSSSGGQQILFAETTAPAAQGDYFRIMNASGSNSLFSPLVSGFGNSHTSASLQFLALANSTKDTGTNALMNFKAGLDFTPITSQEIANAGSNVINRPLFQWMNWNTPLMTMNPLGKVGIGTALPTAQLEVTSVPSVTPTAIIGQGKSTGVYGEATEMTVGQTVDGIAAGWVEAIGVFGKGTYATHTGNGNVYGVVGSAAANNPLNNVGVYGEAKNATGYNSGVLGSVNSTTGIYNTGIGGFVALNPSATWNRAVFGSSPIAPNHFAGYFDGKVAIVDGSQANNYVLTSDANGLATWKDACTLPCFATAFTTDWHTNGNATTTGEFIGTTNANPFDVYTNNIPRMTIDASGKMGLGIATPTGAALHVLTGTNAGMLPPVIKLDRNDATNQAGLLSVGISGNGFASGLLGGGSAYFKLEDPYGNSANSDMGFSTNNLAAQMVIKHSGNVGIGIELPITKLDVQNGAVRIGNTCTPVGYKLYVEEGILTEKVKVAVNCSLAWADYVFANDYSLQPLSEVEKFIKENKHLPNVPSAETLVQEGLDLGKMQAKQMEKIEELTLYLIEMKKEIDILKTENKTLKFKN